jgi:hypothetical protein
MMVGADILNEPYDILVQKYPGGTDLQPKDIKLKGLYERVGRAINRVNPNLLLIVEETKSRRTGKWSLTGRPDLPNLVYSSHWYSPEWNSAGGKPKLVSHVKRAKGWDLPLWLGEFTAMGYTTPDGGLSTWARDTKRFLKYATENDVNWTIWAYGGGYFQLKGSTEPKPGLVKLLKTGF